MTRALLIGLQRRLSEADYDTFQHAMRTTIAMMVVSVAGSVLALATGWLAFGFSLWAGLLLPVLGYISLLSGSTFAVQLFSAFLALSSVSYLVTLFVVTIIAGDVIGCVCSPVCADKLSIGVTASAFGDWSCRHQELARVYYYFSVAFGLAMAALQMATAFYAAHLSFATDLFTVEESDLRPLDPLLASRHDRAASPKVALDTGGRAGGITYAERRVEPRSGAAKASG